MKVNKFYIFPILYIFAVYSPFIIGDWLPEDITGDCILGFGAIVGILNIVACKLYCKPENERVLLRSTILVKYALIPFYIVIFLIALVCLCLTIIPVPFMIFAGPAGAIGFSVIGWIILAISSPYMIAYLHSSHKAGNRSKLTVWIHTVLQFFFCLDILDVMVLSIKENVFKKFSIGLVVFIVLAVIVGFFAIVFGIAKMIVG